MKTLLASLTLLSLAALSAAQTVDAYSSFGAGEAYDHTNGYYNGANPFGDNISAYMPFTATASGTLSGFRVAMGLYGATTAQPFSLTLWSDAGGNVGAALGTFSGVSSDRPYTSAASDVVSVPASGLDLTAGTTYWLQASNPSGASDQSLLWGNSPEGTPDVRYGFTGNGGSLSYDTYRPAAFSVQVGQIQATPEPVTMALGVAAFGMALKRRRKA